MHDRSKFEIMVPVSYLIIGCMFRCPLQKTHDSENDFLEPYDVAVKNII